MSLERVLLASALCLIPLGVEAAPKKPKKSKQERLAERKEAARKNARRKQAEFWVKSLAKPRVQDRFEAVWNLRALTPESIDPLIRLLDSRDGKALVIQDAAEALGEIRSPKSRAALERAVADLKLPISTRLTALISLARLLDAPSRTFLRKIALGQTPVVAPAKPVRKTRKRKRVQPQAVDPVLRRVALLALAMTGDAGVKPAAKVAIKLKGDAETRRAGYRAFGYLKDRTAIPLLIEGLKDPNVLVRGQAANALGKTGDVKTADSLERLVKRLPDNGERFLIVDALAWLGRQTAIRELIRISTTKNHPLQTTAATVLVEIKERSALPHFRKILEEQLRNGNHATGVEQIMAFGVGELADMSSADLLIMGLNKGNPAFQREATTALGVMKAKQATPALLGIVRKGRLFARAGALVALGRIGDKSGYRKILKSVEDRDAPVRWAVAVALERLGEKKAIRGLTKLLKDPHPFVALQAEAAIASLNSTAAERTKLTPEENTSLTRLLALEREYLIRARVGATGPYFDVASSQVEEAPEIIGWESIWSTCGGTHPPVNYGEVPVYRGAEDSMEGREWRETPEYTAWREAQGPAAARAAERQNSEAVFQAGEAASAERVYRLKTIRARVENELTEGDTKKQGGGGMRRP